jgi:cytochrome b561
MSAEVKRYHPALAALHWLLAIAILLAIGFGSLVLDDMANTSIHKPGLLRMHITLGILILVFTIVRLIVRARAAKPAHLVTDSPMMDKLAIGIQHLLYTLTVLVALAGLALAFSAKLFAVLYQGVGSLPKDFEGFIAHEVHGVLAYILLAAIAVHVAGALKHHFILKDGIMSRMALFRKG